MAPVGSFTVGIFQKDSAMKEKLLKLKPGYYEIELNQEEVLLVSKREFMPEWAGDGNDMIFIHMPSGEQYQDNNPARDLPDKELAFYHKMWDEHVADLVEEWKERLNGTVQALD